MYRKKNKEVKDLPFCKECNICSDERVNKCCKCYYMSIDDWNGWKRICLMHQDYCNDIDITECEDWKEYKGVNKEF